MSGHLKHPKLERPELEGLARQQVSFVGTTCGRIAEIFAQLESRLDHRFRIIKVDADHHNTVEGLEIRQDERILQLAPFTGEQWFEDKLLGQYFDLALVNGNHYPSEHQVVFLDTAKEGSLQRRKEQLTDPLLYIRVDCDGFEWLEKKKDVPTISIDDLDAMGSLLEAWLDEGVPTLRALILAGGESQRMGHDKSQIDYHGEPQEVYLAKTCEAAGIPAVISKRQHEGNDIEGFPVLEDSFLGLGPYGAILSAFKTYRKEALLVLACDLPHLDESMIKKLVDERQTNVFMTAFQARSKSFAEPLAAIYEPRMYARMLHGLALGYNCPTKLLRNTDIKSVMVDDETVMNVNTKEELVQVKKDA